jgi:peptidoglycan/xylan/chitin deacetylase (PgdA/CDA1 family)
MYLIKTPWWLRRLYPALTWRIPGREKVLYLTFDDGPHETATPYVLDQLQRFGAKATFFCIGKNVAAYPEIYQRILAEGHAVGNHTQHHVNGWKVSDEVYMHEVKQAAELIRSDLFRPPYGRIKRSQQQKLQTQNPKLQTIMWDVLSADFDEQLTGEACLGYVVYHSKPGSIIVFHDSAKAWNRMQYALPRVLEHFRKEGYSFRTIPTAH